jgi:hypothetical protein
MTNPNDPVNQTIDNYGEVTYNGLTKREYFAAMAMQGMLANSQIDFDNLTYKQYAEDCVMVSDELIKALNQ